MVYRRRNYKPRRRFNKRRGTNYMGLAKKAFSLAKWVASVINVEKKTITTGAVSTSLTSSFAFQALTLCAQGVTDTTRNGNSIKAKSNSFKFTLSLPSTAVVGSEARILIVWDKVSSGTNPAAVDLFDSGSNNYLAHYNRDNAGSRFVILHDKHYALSPNGRQTVAASLYNKLSHHVKYDDTTALIGSATTGHLFVVYCGATEGTIYPVLNFDNVFSFIDN